MPSNLLAAARVIQMPAPAPQRRAPEPDRPAAGPLPERVRSREILRAGEPAPAEAEAGELAGAEAALLPAELKQLIRPAGTSGAEGTLLAVVPIPGTDSSLAVIGYAVPATPAGNAGAGIAAVPQRPDGGLVVDHARRCIWLSGEEVELTYQEFELLAFLSANPVQVFSRADLLHRVWGQLPKSRTRTVDVHVSRLRRKLGPTYGPCLTTEYRVGYRFDPALSTAR